MLIETAKVKHQTSSSTPLISVSEVNLVKKLASLNGESELNIDFKSILFTETTDSQHTFSGVTENYQTTENY